MMHDMMAAGFASVRVLFVYVCMVANLFSVGTCCVARHFFKDINIFIGKSKS